MKLTDQLVAVLHLLVACCNKLVCHFQLLFLLGCLSADRFEDQIK